MIFLLSRQILVQPSNVISCECLYILHGPSFILVWYAQVILSFGSDSESIHLNSHNYHCKMHAIINGIYHRVLRLKKPNPKQKQNTPTPHPLRKKSPKSLTLSQAKICNFTDAVHTHLISANTSSFLTHEINLREIQTTLYFPCFTSIKYYKHVTMYLFFLQSS